MRIPRARASPDALAAALAWRIWSHWNLLGWTHLDKFVVFVPEADATIVLDAMSAVGAGRIGNYERCAFVSVGDGTFRPLAGAPAPGVVGEVAEVAEVRLELVAPRALRAAVVAAMREVHPHEEPAFDVIELAEIPVNWGLGESGR